MRFINKNDVVSSMPLVCGASRKPLAFANFWNNEKCKKLTIVKIESLDRKVRHIQNNYPV